jgi:hypothetical protein
VVRTSELLFHLGFKSSIRGHTIRVAAVAVAGAQLNYSQIEIYSPGGGRGGRTDRVRPLDCIIDSGAPSKVRG